MTRWISALAVMAALSLPALAEAKCYHFSAAPSDVGVCVGKGRDSVDDRKKAMSICSAKLNKSCGNVSSAGASCQSASNRCFDESGSGHAKLDGY